MGSLKTFTGKDVSGVTLTYTAESFDLDGYTYTLASDETNPKSIVLGKVGATNVINFNFTRTAMTYPTTWAVNYLYNGVTVKSEAFSGQ